MLDQVATQIGAGGCGSQNQTVQQRESLGRAFVFPSGARLVRGGEHDQKLEYHAHHGHCKSAKKAEKDNQDLTPDQRCEEGPGYPSKCGSECETEATGMAVVALKSVEGEAEERLKTKGNGGHCFEEGV